MSEDMDKNIQKAIEIISNPETLNGLLSVLGNAGNKQQSNRETSTDAKNENIFPSKDTSKDIGENTLLTNEIGENLELLQRVKEAVGVLNSKKDPRINLLKAITPFMNKKRKKAVNDCIQLLRVSQLLPTILNINNLNKST
ncbi:MAG: hypothetical protein GX387_07580 [Clostridium sp.]|jgi:hypothetical protein|nr:hypothetical protein [Clostridium sp.]